MERRNQISWYSGCRTGPYVRHGQKIDFDRIGHGKSSSRIVALSMTEPSSTLGKSTKGCLSLRTILHSAYAENQTSRVYASVPEKLMMESGMHLFKSNRT